jgi:hypothetical protein
MAGQIYSLDAYIRGKMLDHSSWEKLLPVTPSDIDFVFDNRGQRILLGELNSKTARWDELKTGQRRLYEALVLAGGGKIWAACCRHRLPPPGIQIDTVKDVLEFQWMTQKKGELYVSNVYDGKDWPEFVRRAIFKDRI